MTDAISTDPVPASPTAPRASGAKGAEVAHYRSARRMRSKERRPLALNLAPMIDVTFQLLTFFVLTTTSFRAAEGVLPAKMPSEGGMANRVVLPISPITVRLVQTGTGMADYQIRVDHVLRQPATFDELSAMLADLKSKPGFDAKTPVVIVAADGVRWDHVVNVWNAAVRASFETITFGQN